MSGYHLPGGRQGDGETFSETTVRKVPEKDELVHESHQGAVSEAACLI